MFKKTSSKILLAAALLIINLILWQSILFKEPASGALSITFLDVGEGDAILIDDSFGNQILIDGGYDSQKLLTKLDKAMPFHDRRIELVMLTHPDDDHLNGILSVLGRYQVKNFLYSGLKKDSFHYQDLIALLKKEHLPMQIAQRGQDVVLANGADLYILYPEESLENASVKDLNEYSLVSKLVFGEFSLLLPGDSGRMAEARLLSSGLNLESQVLKVGHHGSKYSTHPLFLMRVNPKVAAISVGKNSYGHPTPEVLERLKNVLTLRTDLNGDIKIQTDGRKMQIVTEK